MCGDPKNNHLWSNEIPHQAGDYLWLDTWHCGCPYESGIVTIYEGKAWDDDDFSYEVYDEELQMTIILNIDWHNKYPFTPNTLSLEDYKKAVLKTNDLWWLKTPLQMPRAWSEGATCT